VSAQQIRWTKTADPKIDVIFDRVIYKEAESVLQPEHFCLDPDPSRRHMWIGHSQNLGIKKIERDKGPDQDPTYASITD
jgi:hypothetical protein